MIRGCHFAQNVALDDAGAIRCKDRRQTNNSGLSLRGQHVRRQRWRDHVTSDSVGDVSVRLYVASNITTGATADGGALAVASATAYVTNCVFTGNHSADNGGGIFGTEGATLHIFGCQFVANRADDHGGGLYMNAGAGGYIVECLFERNVGIDGGAIGLNAAAPLVSRCRLLDNEAWADGGGIRLKDGADALVEGCLIARNLAHADGGGLECLDANGALRHNTIMENRAFQYGGGLNIKGASAVSVTNTIVWGNEAVYAATDQTNVAAAGRLEFDYSIIQGWTSGGTGNSSADPLLTGGECRLRHQSPSIDSGVATTLVEDFEREARWDDPAHDNTPSSWDRGGDEFRDSDADGLADAWELARFGDLSATATQDHDGDGLQTLDEYRFGTDPFSADTDGDTLSDYDEVVTHAAFNLSPLMADSNGDGLGDALVVETGWTGGEALDDDDGDGVANIVELWAGTDPDDSDDPPAADTETVSFYVCDQSTSESELYAVALRDPNAPPSRRGYVTFVQSTWDGVDMEAGSGSFKLIKGRHYQVKIVHTGRVSGNEPDYNYVFKINEFATIRGSTNRGDLAGDTWFYDAPVAVHDPTEKLGTYDFDNPDPPQLHDGDSPVDLFIIKVESVELISGATANHVTPPHTWAAVKNTNSPTEYVLVRAEIEPDIDPTLLPAGFISWSGGEAVATNQLQRKVPKNVSAHTELVASCGGSSATGHVWVLWSEVTVTHTGDKTAYNAGTDTGNDKEFPTIAVVPTLAQRTGLWSPRSTSGGRSKSKPTSRQQAFMMSSLLAGISIKHIQRWIS